MLLTKL